MPNRAPQTSWKAVLPSASRQLGCILEIRKVRWGMTTTQVSDDGALVIPFPGRVQGAVRSREQSRAQSIRHASFDWRLCVMLPLALLTVLTVAFRVSDADVVICRLFYGGDPVSWPLLRAAPLQFLYHFGTIPAWLIGVGGLSVWLEGLRRNKPFAREGLFCALILVIGPGLIVNTVLKPYCHRPRPNQIVDFGGNRDFVPVLSIGQGTGHDFYRSFPCGHASMGFYLMVPAFVLRRRKPTWAAAFTCAGLLAGLLIGLTRIAQGRHFPSDVIWSGALVYFTALVLYYALGLHRQATAESTVELAAPDAPIIIPFDRARRRGHGLEPTYPDGREIRRAA